ncbi:sulfurtransferase [Kineococcus indalonis]|uniref:sulfurtransferase n=1 Tax=Kineococcus indalonis TaxID=2696566 RepID=UPI001412D47E|nr:rhodanese-like domain-containing protein [Kineococcus indalonis]NAZ84795.1 sulfurtransferase [Kineococcus indalonis]
MSSWRADPAAPAEAVLPLVDARWLQAHRDAVVVLQVDDDATPYHAGHLPGSLPLSTYDDLHERVRRGPVSRQGFERLMSALGVGVDDHVVLCSAGSPSHAAYAFWVMRLYGHRRLSLLDGGLPAWTAAGGELEDAPVVVAAADYRTPGRDPSVIVGRDELLTRYVGAPDPVLILDCRTEAEYEGHVQHQLDVVAERHRVPGHIPGSRNLPSGELLEGRAFAPLERLRTLFADRGLTAGSDVVVYCRVADRSSLLWFALAELLQHPRVRHYVGGWAEYGSLVDVPVELH